MNDSKNPAAQQAEAVTERVSDNPKCHRCLLSVDTMTDSFYIVGSDYFHGQCPIVTDESLHQAAVRHRIAQKHYTRNDYEAAQKQDEQCNCVGFALSGSIHNEGCPKYRQQDELCDECGHDRVRHHSYQIAPGDIQIGGCQNCGACREYRPQAEQKPVPRLEYLKHGKYAYLLTFEGGVRTYLATEIRALENIAQTIFPIYSPPEPTPQPKVAMPVEPTFEQWWKGLIRLGHTTTYGDYRMCNKCGDEVGCLPVVTEIPEEAQKHFRGECAAPANQGCQCKACEITPHLSSCAVHNMPAEPNGECDCDAKSLTK